MIAIIAWGEATLCGSAVLMLLVLATRGGVRRWFGARCGYALWALPALRMVLPMMPAHLFDHSPVARLTTRMSVVFTGPDGASAVVAAPPMSHLETAGVVLWSAGAIGLLAIYAIRHRRYCRALLGAGQELYRVGSIRVIATTVDGPLAFGIVRRFIAVPRDFSTTYREGERELAIAHEAAHHMRGDLIANWAALIVLATHWWNPIAWAAIRAFREDQECATDAQVLAGKGPGTRAAYAHVLAKAAGVDAPPACSLNARCNLKGRLMMMNQAQRSRARRVTGGVMLALLGSAALATTAMTVDAPGGPAGRQAVTIGVKPDGAGAYRLIVGSAAVSPGAALPEGMTLPSDFTGPGGCDLTRDAKPAAMVIKGATDARTYTVMCASAAPRPIAATLREGLASLTTMRASVATQPATRAFPETERSHALAAIDRSIGEVEAALATVS